MSPSQNVRAERFGADGVVTDIGPEALSEAQLAAAENMLLTDDRPSERGGWTTAGDNNPLGASGTLQSVLAVKFPGQSTVNLIVTSDEPDIGKATSGSSGSVGTVTGGTPRARCTYRGEVVITNDDGITPIRRTVGTLTTPTSGTGSYTIYYNNRVIEGSGSNFDPHVPVGSYLGKNNEVLVVGRLSDTAATAERQDGFEFSQSTGTNPVLLGKIGLTTLVTEAGQISFTSGSATAAGTSTLWNTTGAGFGQVKAGDLIVPVKIPRAASTGRSSPRSPRTHR